jgi:hypothetical protein
VNFENFDRSTGRSVIKDADASRPVYHASVSRLVRFFLADRPMWMLMVPVYDVALTVAAVIIVRVDFLYDFFGVLLIQRTVWINTRVYENAMRIDVH